MIDARDIPELAGIPDPGRLVNNHQAVATLQRALADAPRNLEIVLASFRRVIRERAWLERLDPLRNTVHIERIPPDDQAALRKSFCAFVTTPYPGGLGINVDVIERLIKDDPDLHADFVLLTTGGPGGANNPEGLGGKSGKVAGNGPIVNHDIIMVDKSSQPTPSLPTVGQGTSKEYAYRRLARGRPDLLARVRKGELSANAAMIEAGFRKVPTPLEIITRLLPRLQPNELTTLRDAVNAAITNTPEGVTQECD